MPTPLSAATGGLRSCGPHQASVWACLPTAWQSLGRPKMTPGGQPDRRRRWKMPSPPCVHHARPLETPVMAERQREDCAPHVFFDRVGRSELHRVHDCSSFFELGKRRKGSCTYTRPGRQKSPTHPPPETPPVPPAQTQGTLAPSEVRPPAARQHRPRRRVRPPSMRGGRGAGRAGSRGSSRSARAGWC